MKRFLGVLKKIGMVAGKAAPEVVSVWNPPLGALLGTILQGVVHAEGTVGAGNGAQKRELAMGSIMIAGPLIEQIASHAAGRKIDIDEQQLSDGVGMIIDGMVKLMNATGALPKAK